MENTMIHADVWKVHFEDDTVCYKAVVFSAVGSVAEDLGLFELESDAWIAIENYESIR